MLLDIEGLSVLIGRTDQSNSDSPVSYEQGVFLASSYEAIGYFELIGSDTEGITEVFNSSISMHAIHLKKFKGFLFWLIF